MAPWIWVGDTKTKATPPPFLYKYLSPSGVEKTTSDNTLKWELPCDENDPFEAFASGWDNGAIRREEARTSDNCTNKINTASMDAIFKHGRLQKKISHIAAFVSFSEHSDNILMWSHYAEKHTGACIEFDSSCLQELDKLEPVTYAEQLDSERKRIPLPNDEAGDFSDEFQKSVRAFLSHKANVWAYEEEWRWIVPPLADCVMAKEIDDKHILVSTIPKGAVKRLIFGCNSPVSKRLAWAKQIRKEHPSCQFAEVVPNPRLFKLEINALEIDPILADDSDVWKRRS